MAYSVVRTDKMHGTYNAADLVSVRYAPSGTDTAINNGHVVKLVSLESNSREVYIGDTPDANTPLNQIALIATPELLADERKKSLKDFRNEAGQIARGYRLRSGDIFSVTVDALTPINNTAPAAGQVVELQADTKLKLTASLTSGSTQVGTVIAVEGEFVVIEVI